MKAGFVVLKGNRIQRVARRAVGVFASCALLAALMPAGAVALNGVTAYTPDDTLADSSFNYYIENEDFATAYGISGEAGGITVAVIDSGVSMAKSARPEDLANTVDYTNAWDCSSGKSEPLAANYVDTMGHGTKVAYVLGSEVGNGVDGAGSSYNANILPINIYSAKGKTNISAVMRAYEHVFEVAEELNIKVVNLSFGADTSSFTSDELVIMNRLQQLITKAYAEYGIFTVAAAGNYSTEAAKSSSNSMYPAALRNVFAVAAVDETSTALSMSYYNRYVDACAAGSNIYFTEEYEDENGDVVEATKASGTSYAAAIVSGVAALMYNVNPSLTASEAESILKGTAIDLGETGTDVHYGAGLVNAAHAVYSAQLIDEGDHSDDAYQVTTEESYASGGEIYYHCPTCGYEFTLKTADALKLGKVKSLKAESVDSAKATLAWAAVGDATGYELTYRVNKSGAKWSTIMIEPGSETSATIKKLKSSTSYKVRVRAYVVQDGQTVYGSYSSTVKFKTKAAS